MDAAHDPVDHKEDRQHAVGAVHVVEGQGEADRAARRVDLRHGERARAAAEQCRPVPPPCRPSLADRPSRGLEQAVAAPPATRHLADLGARADVFLQNLAPGAADRLGFGGVASRARHPRLVTVGLPGYGAGGPFEHRRAYDMLVRSEAGSPR